MCITLSNEEKRGLVNMSFTGATGAGGFPASVSPPATAAPTSDKPVCGSDSEEGEYDLPLHVAALCKLPRIRAWMKMNTTNSAR